MKLWGWINLSSHFNHLGRDKPISIYPLIGSPENKAPHPGCFFRFSGSAEAELPKGIEFLGKMYYNSNVITRSERDGRVP